MAWDATIAASAQAWADGGYWGHSSSASRTLAGIGYVGENLAWGYPSRSGTNSVDSWYEEIAFTDETPASCSDTLPGSEGEMICHYTQVVWKSSVLLGCGKGRAEVQGYDGDFWVCQYSAGGNMQGDFAANVLPVAKSASECTSGSSGPAPGPAPDPAPGPAPGPAPAPTPGPGPGPAPAPSSPGADCRDGGQDESPYIVNPGTKARYACAEISWACGYDFVANKCKFTCATC